MSPEAVVIAAVLDVEAVVVANVLDVAGKPVNVA
jgi:hypothetical protein